MGERTIRFGQSVPAIVLLALAMALPVRCQQAGDASLTISFTNGQTQFHVGEIIPLKLAFTASAERVYELDMRNYDRSGRLDFEQFHVSPAGRDPLYDYYHGGMFGGFAGGGIGRGTPYLDTRPQVVREDLNEWVALDRPGQYALYVTSSRVSRSVGSTNQQVELRSNTLYFEVVAADPAWQEQTLDTAVGTLDDPESSPDQRLSALRTLRFLDSPGSVRELVKLLGTPGNRDSWDCLAGLMGSTHRKLVVSELQEQFAAPGTAITSSYITALAAMRVLLTQMPMPSYPTQGKPQQRQWMSLQRDRMRQFQRAEDAVYARAAAVIAVKQGRAKAETVQTILSKPDVDISSTKPWTALSGDTLATAFLHLPPEEQAMNLFGLWDRMKVPAMAWALDKVLDQPWIDNQQLRDIAMLRLYELDPEEGEARILEEIRQPHVDMADATVSIQTLGLLPNKTLPQFDDLLAARLEKGNRVPMALTAELIGRYATKAILQRVRTVYLRAPGKWACRIEDGLMTYFLRVDPDFGVQQMVSAPNLCMTDAFQAVVKLGKWAAVEPAIIGKLNDPNLQTARQAADVLRKYGGEKAEKALWRRLQQFHKQWANRDGELRYRPNMSPAAFYAMNFQGGLVEALGRAQGWLLDGGQIAQLEELTVGAERDSLAQWRWKSPLDLMVSFTYWGQMQASIGGIYSTTDLSALCAKLAEFPGGTQFHVDASGPTELVGPVMRAIDDAADENGLVLVTAN